MNTQLVLDPDLHAVAEFMQRNIPTTKLCSVADAIPTLGKLLWQHHEGTVIEALALQEPAILDGDRPIRLAANE